MEYLGFGILALGLISGAWLLMRLMGSVTRNEGDRHGGGFERADHE